MESMFDRLDTTESRYEEINSLMAQEDVVSDMEMLQKLAQEQASIKDLVAQYRKYKKTLKTIQETKALQNDGLDEEMATLVTEELERLDARREQLLAEIKRRKMSLSKSAPVLEERKPLSLLGTFSGHTPAMRWTKDGRWKP